MTISPDRVGDKGQRFELHVMGWPKAGDNVIGWARTSGGLADAGHSLLTTNRSVTSAWVVDRHLDEIIEIPELEPIA